MNAEPDTIDPRFACSHPLNVHQHLATGQIQVWALRLEASEAHLEGLAQCLAADELAKAMRYSVEHARREFMLTRAALRKLLAGYLGDSPSALRFAVAPRGKPAVLGCGSQQIDFNVSHSGGVALLAFTSGCAIGVDIESRRPLPDLPLLVDRVFDSAAAAHWHALPATEQLDAFYRAWVRKEACAKTSGNGLWADLKALDQDGELAVHDIRIGTSHTAALAHAGAARVVTPTRWIDADALLSGGGAFAMAA